MGFRALHIFLWLLTSPILTTQELVRLSTSPKIAAECGKQVTLDCDVSSSRNGLSVRFMEWALNKTCLCSVDNEGRITTHRTHTLSDFHCEYEHGQLSLIVRKVRPLDSAIYRCKLQSKQGAAHKYTAVELQDCCGIVEGVQTSDGHICTFNHVYPDGDVHWFHGSHNLTARSRHYIYTTKRVDEWGWLTIHSYLKQRSSDGPYNCSLMSTRSGRYIASTLIQNPEFQVRGKLQVRNGVGSQGHMRTFYCLSILLAVTMK